MEFNVAAGIFHPFATTTQIARDGTHRSHITKKKKKHPPKTEQTKNTNKTKQNKLKTTQDQWVHQGGGRRKESICFNNAFNTDYLQLYGVGIVVKDHLDSERGNSLPPLHTLLSLISSKGYCMYIRPLLYH